MRGFSRNNRGIVIPIRSMRETRWFKAVIGGTLYRVYHRHFRWQHPGKPHNENERRVRK